MAERNAHLCECGHFEAQHSDGLPDDPNRLCSACHECQGYITPAQRREDAANQLDGWPEW